MKLVQNMTALVTRKNMSKVVSTRRILKVLFWIRSWEESACKTAMNKV